MPIIRENACPCCGHKSNAATSLQDESLRPEPGDLSICINCGEFLQYGEGLVIHEMPEEVLDNIHPDLLDELLEARKMIIARGQVQ